LAILLNRQREILMQISPRDENSAILCAALADILHHGTKTKESRSEMPVLPDVAGNAALAICESLLLALNDREILPEHEIVGVLKDAAAAHENAPPGDGIEEMHKAVAELINKIIDGGNSVRRP
jgi:hypothetical protein